jgi:hypothetical protein
MNYKDGISAPCHSFSATIRTNTPVFRLTADLVQVAPAMDVLELPEVPDFISQTPCVPLESVSELSRYYVPRLLMDSAFWRARAEERCMAEFDLFHPERAPATHPLN